VKSTNLAIGSKPFLRRVDLKKLNGQDGLLIIVWLIYLVNNWILRRLMLVQSDFFA
jgi:hypothetical protein